MVESQRQLMRLLVGATAIHVGLSAAAMLVDMASMSGACLALLLTNLVLVVACNGAAARRLAARSSISAGGSTSAPDVEAPPPAQVTTSKYLDAGEQASSKGAGSGTKPPDDRQSFSINRLKTADLAPAVTSLASKWSEDVFCNDHMGREIGDIDETGAVVFHDEDRVRTSMYSASSTADEEAESRDTFDPDGLKKVQRGKRSLKRTLTGSSVGSRPSLTMTGKDASASSEVDQATGNRKYKRRDTPMFEARHYAHINLNSSPMAQVIKLVNRLEKSLDPEQHRQLAGILGRLKHQLATAGEHLFRPNISKELDRAQNMEGKDSIVDDEVRTLVQSLTSTPTVPALARDPKRGSLLISPADAAKATRQHRDTEFKATAGSQLHESLDMVHRGQKNRVMLHSDWAYSVLELARQSDGQPLRHMLLAVIADLDIHSRLSLPISTLDAFAQRIEAGYRADNTYHNSTHAADVVQAIYSLLYHSRIYSMLSDTDLLSITLAAAVHDFEHPGVNNTYLIAEGDPIAIAYNDRSVLENHHVAAAFIAMSKQRNTRDCNVLACLSSQAQKRARRVMIQTVLATDMSLSFDIIGKFDSAILSGRNAGQSDSDSDGGTAPALPNIDYTDGSTVELILSMFIKVADISHPARPWESHYEWSRRCAIEFYEQGDAERSKGRDVLPFMDKSRDYLPKSQLGFIQFVVMPMYESFSKLTGRQVMEPLFNNVEINVERWRQMSIRKESVPTERSGFPDVAPRVSREQGSVIAMVDKDGKVRD